MHTLRQSLIYFADKIQPLTYSSAQHWGRSWNSRELNLLHACLLQVLLEHLLLLDEARAGVLCAALNTAANGPCSLPEMLLLLLQAHFEARTVLSQESPGEAALLFRVL